MDGPKPASSEALQRCNRSLHYAVCSPFGGDVKAAFTIQRDAFHVDLLRRIAVLARDWNLIDDCGWRCGCVDFENRRLKAVEAIIDGLDDTIRIGDHAGNRAPSDKLISTGRCELRIGWRRVLQLIDHDVAAHAAVFDQVRFIRCHEQVARRDRNSPLLTLDNA